MDSPSSRRDFLASLAALPAAPAFPSEPTLPSVTLGRTGLNITNLVFGSMITSDVIVIQRAADMGVNCFATSREYQKGNNERLLGAALKGRGDKVIVATESIDMMWRPKTEKETTAYVLGNLDASLRDLQTDHVDLFFLHHKDEPGWIPDEALEAVRIAKKQGKVRHLGVTTHSLPKMAGYLAKNDLFEVVVAIYNFTMDAKTHAAAKTLHDAGVAVIAMKVMAGGLEGEKPLPQLKRPGAFAAALKWAIHNPNVDAALVSVADHEQLESNLRAVSEPFTSEDDRLLSAALSRIGPRYCRLCGRCAGTCSQGLPIPDILRAAMYAEGYGQFALGRDKFLELPAVARAETCEQCTSCSVRCAFNIPVSERVRHARRLLA